MSGSEPQQKATTNQSVTGKSVVSNFEESKNEKDALTRIKQIEQVMQNFEK
jgi:hypothetical protein